MSTKTNKSYSKRLKVTKNGKILARSTGQGHFNAKESGRANQKKNHTSEYPMSNKDIARFIKK